MGVISMTDETNEFEQLEEEVPVKKKEPEPEEKSEEEKSEKKKKRKKKKRRRISGEKEIGRWHRWRIVYSAE
jgi:hypothetical protein